MKNKKKFMFINNYSNFKKAMIEVLSNLSTTECGSVKIELRKGFIVDFKYRLLTNFEMDFLNSKYFVPKIKNLEDAEKARQWSYHFLSKVIVDPEFSVEDFRNMDIVTFNKINEAITHEYMMRQNHD